MKGIIKDLYKFFFNENLIQYVPCPAQVTTPVTTPVVIPIVKTNGQMLYEKALTFLGQDASPNDLAPDEYGCQETVDTIYYACFGEYINPLMKTPSLSTNETYKYLLTSKKFVQVTDYQAGDIIISPTGYGNGTLTSGHTGIMGKNNIIMSNNSYNGKWEENYTTTTWKSRYAQAGGFPIAYFRKV